MAMKMAASQIMRVLLIFMCDFSSLKKITASRALETSQCGNKSHIVAFLRQHYPDQVRGTGRQYVTSQPACASTPWIVRIFYHGCRFLSIPQHTCAVYASILRRYALRG